MKNKSGVYTIILLIFIIIFGVAYYCSPLLNIYNIKQAIINKDEKRLSELIEFDSLRNDIDSQIIDVVENQLGTKDKNDALSNLTRETSKAVIVTSVNFIISPEIIKNINIPQSQDAPHNFSDNKINKHAYVFMPIIKNMPDFKNKENIGFKIHWISLGEANVDIFDKTNIEKNIVLKMEKSGFINWRLYGVILPPNMEFELPTNFSSSSVYNLKLPKEFNLPKDLDVSKILNLLSKHW